MAIKIRISVELHKCISFKSPAFDPSSTRPYYIVSLSYPSLKNSDYGPD